MSEHEDATSNDTAALEAEIARLRAENETLNKEHDTVVLNTDGAAAQPSAPPTEHHRLRWTGAIVLLLIAALLTPPALVGFWGQRTVTDAERYLATVAPLADSPEIRAAVSTAVSEELISRVDINGFIQTNLPPAAAALAPSITGAVENFVQSTVDKFMASDAFDKVWLEVNAQIQQDVVKALNGDDTGTVSVRDGVVYLNVAVIAQGVQAALVARGLTIFEKITIPSQGGREIVLLTSPQLAAAQNIWTYTEPIAKWMLPVVILLYLGAIFLAPNRRRMLLVAGLVIVAGMAMLAVALNLARSAYVDAVETSGFGAALALFYDTMLRYLWGSLGALVTLGVFLAFFAWMAGPSSPARWARGVEATATTALGDTAGRWEPMTTVGGFVASARLVLRGLLIAVIIVVFIANGLATWGTVLWAIGIGIAGWLIIDVLAAARSAQQPVPEDTEPVPVDA